MFLKGFEENIPLFLIFVFFIKQKRLLQCSSVIFSQRLEIKINKLKNIFFLVYFYNPNIDDMGAHPGVCLERWSGAKSRPGARSAEVICRSADVIL